MPQEESDFSPGDYNDLVFLNIARAMKTVDIVNHLIELEAGVESVTPQLQAIIHDTQTAVGEMSEHSDGEAAVRPPLEFSAFLVDMAEIAAAQELARLQACRDVEERGRVLLQGLGQGGSYADLHAPIQKIMGLFRSFWESRSKALVYGQVLRERNVSFIPERPMGQRRISEFADWLIELKPHEYKNQQERLQQQLNKHVTSFNEFMALVDVDMQLFKNGGGETAGIERIASWLRQMVQGNEELTPVMLRVFTDALYEVVGDHYKEAPALTIHLQQAYALCSPVRELREMIALMGKKSSPEG